MDASLILGRHLSGRIFGNRCLDDLDHGLPMALHPPVMSTAAACNLSCSWCDKIWVTWRRDLCRLLLLFDMMFVLLTRRFALGTIERCEVAAGVFLVRFNNPANWLAHDIRRASMQTFIALFSAQSPSLHIFGSDHLRCLHFHQALA